MGRDWTDHDKNFILTCSEGPRGEELVLSGAAFLGTRAVSPQPEGWECQPTQRNTLN